MLRAARKAIGNFISDDCFTQAAALAYYTIFSLPPLLLVLISMMGWLFGKSAAQGNIQQQLQNFVGYYPAQKIGAIVAKAGQERSAGTIGAALGLLALGFAATSAFVQLQTGLNLIWRVVPDPKAGGVRNFIVQRILSFVMMAVIALVLLISMVVAAGLQAIGGVLQGFVPAILSVPVLQASEFVVSLAIITVLVAATFKYLPDAQIRWSQVWHGAIATAALFTVGKFLIGLYLANSGQASIYGVAGSLILIVLWVYYSSMILLLGAEFTRALSIVRGHPVRPKKGAVCVTTPEPIAHSGR